MCDFVNQARKMVNALEKEHKKVPLRDTKFDFSESAQRELDDFVSKKTLQFFKKLNLSHQFLSTDPVSWADRDDYQTAEKTVLALKVVNDHAERGVALVQQYNKLLTKNEEQFQFLLQVVSEHQKKFPDSRKTTLLQPTTD